MEISQVYISSDTILEKESMKILYFCKFYISVPEKYFLYENILFLLSKKYLFCMHEDAYDGEINVHYSAHNMKTFR